MSFGIDKIKEETPTWAKWMFRITLILTTVTTFWIGGTSLIEDNIKVEITNALKAFDVLMLAFSKMFGVTPDDEEQN